MNDAGGRTTRELVEQARRGECAAFDTLYWRHHAAVRSALRKFGTSGADVDDAVQETFMRAFARLGSLRAAEQFLGWLLVIAKNVAIDQGRRRPGLDIPVDPFSVGDTPCPAPSPEDVSAARELAGRVRLALSTLRAPEAHAITLAVVDGRSGTDLATAMGLSPGAAKVALHRARRRLRAQLALAE